MALQNARNQYLKTQIETASKEQLVVMLFDGIIRFTEQARKAIQESNIEESHHALMRAQAIVMELICTVDKDKGGDIATNIMSLHAYAFNCLIVCNMKKDVAKIDEVQKIYRELREAWVGAMDTLGISSTAAKPVSAPATAVPAQAAPAAKAPAAGPAPIPKAPLAAAMPKPAAAPVVLGAPKAAPAAPANPKVGPSGGGILASGASSAPQMVGKPAAAPAAAKPAVPQQPGLARPAAAVAPQPALQVAPQVAAKPAAAIPATGYGMGKTALMSGAAKNAYAAAKAPASASTPASAASPKIAAAAVNPNQAAMLNAYAANTRSIA